MAQTQISEKMGASGSVFQADQKYNPQMSAFDLSRKLATTMSEGAIVPLDIIRLLPGDKIDYNCRFLLDALIVPLLKSVTYIFQG